MKREASPQLWYVTYVQYGPTRFLVLIGQVNVELPDIPPPKDFDDTFQQMFYMEKRMFDLNARFMPVRPLYLSLMIADNSMYTMGNGGVDSRLRSGLRYVLRFCSC
jgi:hypothetical protein